MSSGRSTHGYIGSKLCLISNCGIRYEGILYAIDPENSTVSLQNVRAFGTEGRKVPEIRAIEEVYGFMVFNGKDIKELTVCMPSNPIPDDPAIIAVNSSPPPTMSPTNQFGQGSVGHDPAMAANGYFSDRTQFDRTSGMPRNAASRSMMYGGGRSEYRKQDLRNGYPYGLRRGFQYGGYNGGTMPNDDSSTLVGQLAAQPNDAVKSEVAEAFDFEGANAKFDKSTVKPEITAASAEVAGAGEKTTTKIPVVRSGYDKAASFFDNISCETLDRRSGQDAQIDRAKQRQVDTQTFGASAAAATCGSRYRRVYRRNIGGYRRNNRFNGGYYDMYGGGMTSVGMYGAYPSDSPQPYSNRY